ncbi:MAG TPA: hypothetical protein VGK87_16030 [Anaerolineae bacterium]
MIVYDSARKPMTLGPELSRGGEGAVYPLPAQPGLIAKLYTHPPQDYADKLAWMRTHPPDDPGLNISRSGVAPHASIAWPLDLLYNPPGQFAGYVMPRITNASSLLGVFNPRTRARTLPNFDWRYQHRTARNLAKALNALHDKNYVIGDLNESNVLVTPSALVTLIDTDSFQVHAHGRMFYCPVGKPEYTPPELQGRSFRDLPRKPEHDSFGLGVLVFQLLMDGSHPFRAQWLGTGDPPSIEERIKQGWFPYLSGSGGPVAPPPNVPPLNVLHPRLVELLQRCFVTGHDAPSERPGAGEWVEALADAEKALTNCVNGHVYSGHQRACPRCDAPNPHLLAVPGFDTFNGGATRLQATWKTVRGRTPVQASVSQWRLPRWPHIAPLQWRLPQWHVPAALMSGLRTLADGVRDITIPLWVGWLAAAVVEWLAGALIADPLSAQAGDDSVRFLIALAYGVLTGLSQWLAVRKRMREAFWWASLTALAVTVGTMADRAFGIPMPGSSTILLMTAAQSAILYSRAPGLWAFVWMLANPAAWVMAIALTAAMPAAIPATIHPPAAALLYGAFTGICFTLLLRATKRFASTPMLLRLRLLGIGWRDVTALIALMLLVVAAVALSLQPCAPLALWLKLGQCAHGVQ